MNGNSDTFTDAVTTYTEGSFSFVGTGSDTLVIAARTDPSEWYADDFSVVGSGQFVNAQAPDMGATAMMLSSALAAIGFVRRRRR